MGEYAPSTDEVREGWKSYLLLTSTTYASEQRAQASGRRDAQFYRWLADTLATAFEDYATCRYEAFLVNPNLDVMDQPEGMARRYKMAAEDHRSYAADLRGA